MSLPGDAGAPLAAGAGGYVIFSLGSGVAFAGIWAQRTAVGWLAWDLTRSVSGVGLFILAELLAALWVAPLSGALADQSRPYRLLLLTGAGSCLLALLLGLLVVTGWLTLPLFWMLVFLDASLRGVRQPVQMLVPGLLSGPETLARAVAASGVTMALAISIGPAMAGLCIRLFDSLAWVFMLNAAAFLIFAAVLQYLRPQLDRVAATRRVGLGQAMMTGLHYAWTTPQLRQILLLALVFSVLARPFAELLPALVGEVFQAGPGLMTAQGCGAVAGALFMLRAQDREQLFLTLRVAGFGIVLALLLFVGTRQTGVLLAALALALAGVCHVICNICMQSLCQLYSLPQLRGRVLALYGLVFRLAPVLGAFVMTQLSVFVPLDVLVAGLVLIHGVYLLVAGRSRQGSSLQARG